MKNHWFKKYLQIPFLKLVRNLNFRRVFLGFVFFVITVILLGLGVFTGDLDVQEGQPSPRDLAAPSSTSFVSEILTEEARQAAAESVEPAYRVDNQILAELAEEIDNYFNLITRAQNNADLSEESRIQTLREDIKFPLTAEEAAALLKVQPDALNQAKAQVTAVVRQVMENGIQKEALDTARQTILQEIENLGLDQTLTRFSSRMINQMEIKPNLVYDPLSTQEKLEQARREVDPVVVNVQRNEMIVRQGDIVTAVDIEKLQQLGLLQTTPAAIRILGLALIVAAVYLLLIFYLYFFQRNLLLNEKLLLLLGILLVVTMVAARGVTAISLGENSEMGRLVGFLAPLAAGAMLTSILLDSSLAVVFAMITSLFLGLTTGNSLGIAAVGLVSSLAGILSINRLSQRSDLAKSSLYIGAAAILSIAGLGLFQGASWTTIALATTLGLGNGILSAVLTIGILPFFESAFGITSTVRLLELSNPNQPLLRRLLLEAPGTYHHSILVGNLAEAAAEAVGADPVLARVGAYYHDIGKLKRPYFFIENQVARENPHDRLAPSLSTLIITSHIKDGLDMARDAGLPPVIQEFVGQHHGNGVLSFFYNKALENEHGEMVFIDDFRYDGAKPQRKEVAILMLADSVEAGVRSMQKPTPQRMETFVRKIIKNKLEDGQLDKSNLTLNELDIIAETFLRVLTGIFHSRVEYPENVIMELEGRRKSGSFHTKSAG